MEWLQTCQEEDANVYYPHWQVDGEGGQKQPKGRSLRIAEIGCVLGSPSLKTKHKIVTVTTTIKEGEERSEGPDAQC